MKIELIKQTWKPVFQIQKGTKLLKGRHGIYWDVRKACQQLTNRFGCYSWQSAGQVHYCGSFAKDNKEAEFESNLEGRVHNYFQNHRVNSNGRTNTNKHVFDLINTTLKTDSVQLAVLEFDSVELADEAVQFADYCTDPDLVKAVEALLICHYRRRNQCSWNRT